MKLRNVSLAPQAFLPPILGGLRWWQLALLALPPSQLWFGISLFFLPVGPQLSLLCGSCPRRGPEGPFQASTGARRLQPGQSLSPGPPGTASDGGNKTTARPNAGLQMACSGQRTPAASWRPLLSLHQQLPSASFSPSQTLDQQDLWLVGGPSPPACVPGSWGCLH